jgi:hypothetical protein
VLGINFTLTDPATKRSSGKAMTISLTPELAMQLALGIMDVARKKNWPMEMAGEYGPGPKAN